MAGRTLIPQLFAGSARPEDQSGGVNIEHCNGAVMRRDEPVDGRIIGCALCADPDEQNAGYGRIGISGP